MKTPTKSNPIPPHRYMEPKSDPEVSRASEVDQAFVDLSNAQDQIEKLVTALRDRLQPVLRQEPPTPLGTTPLSNGPTPYSAPLAQRIHNVSDNLSANARLLEDVLSRLEV